jgi:hypothetical protein
VTDLLESHIKEQCVQFCQYRGAHVIKIIGHLAREGDRVFKQRPGILDLLVCYKGAFLGIEVKTPKGRVTPSQQQEIEAILRAGGRAIVARCVEDVEAALKEIDGEGT